MPYRELDDALGLSEIAGDVLTDTRRGKNGRHGLVGQFRQSVFGRLGGYDDVNDAERVVAFYNQRGKAEQYINEGKNAIKWTRPSCRKFRDNAVRLQLHALSYNLGNFMRTLALPKEMDHWSLTTLREKLVKIGAKVVRHGRYVTFQLAEVAVPRGLFQRILAMIDDLRRRPGLA